MLQPAMLDGRSATAAAVEAVSGAASVAQELRPLLPELLPGLQHTGQLFVRTFVRRVAQRAGESLQLPGGIMTAEQQEEAIAMAALNFMPRAGAPASAGFFPGAGAASAGFASSSSSRGSALTGQFGFRGGAGQGVGGGLGWQPTSMGQLVTGLAAAPFLAVLTPLAILSELQQQQQDDDNSQL
jgi:hypothetical protein